MIIRKAKPDEGPGVISFYEKIIKTRTEQDYKLWWDLEIYPTREDLTNAVNTGAMHIISDDGRITGAAILNNTQGDGYDLADWICEPKASQIAVIHLVAIDPDVRGKGLAKALIEYLIDTAKGMGIKSLRLDTMPHYSYAIRLYETTGFKRVKEIELTYPTTGKAVFYLYEMVLGD
ncbi:MAG: GNAT family N-acetyltransferase [Lachnospiraceae bacterium]|nr:GNAT family N-acetyltransferase [Lachnospiraceae bacterium]